MRPGDTATFIVGRQTAAGSPVTGLVTADFTVAVKVDGVVTSVSPTVTERDTVGGYREYAVAFALPASSAAYAFHCRIVPTTGSDVIAPNVFQGEVETQDLDSTYAVAASPQVSQSGATKIVDELPLQVIAYSEQPISCPRTDQNGAVIDLSGYNNWRFTVWDKTHSGGAALYTLSSGITGSSLGVVDFTIPENASFYSQITAAIAAGNDQVELYYDVKADAAATASKSRCIMRGKLYLLRNEGAA